MIHAITTLHELILSGEIMERRATTGTGAAVSIEHGEQPAMVLTRNKRRVGVGETSASGRP